MLFRSGFKNYDYENIHLDAEYGKRGISGKLVINDQNGSLFIDGTINLEDKIPSFNFTAGMQNIYPNRLNLTKQYEDADFSVKMKANFQGSSIDNLTGTINIDSLYFNASHKSYFMEHLSIKASNKNSLNTLTVNSEFIKAKIEGSYKYKTLPHSLTNIVHHYLPSVFPEKIRIKEVNNNFDFDINVFDTKILETMLNIPLHLYTPATIKGYVSDQTQRVRLEGYFPRLRYKNNYIESGMFMCTNSSDQIESKVRFTNRKSNDAFNVSLFATAATDGIQTTIDWGNNANMTYSGKLATMTQFVRTKEQPTILKTTVDIEPTHVILNDTTWNIHSSTVVVDSGKVDIDNFCFSSQERFIRIDGKMSNNPIDAINVELKDINIGYVFDIIQVTDDVVFEGDATGKVYASNVFADPKLNAHLNFSDFALNDGSLGSLDVKANWDNQVKGIYLDAHIAEGEIAESTVRGYIYPLQPNAGLDLRIDAKELNIKFIERYMESIVEDLQGRVSGNVHFYGKFKELTLDGTVKIGRAHV